MSTQDIPLTKPKPRAWVLGFRVLGFRVPNISDRSFVGLGKAQTIPLAKLMPRTLNPKPLNP